jgi:hypothetical protein
MAKYSMNELYLVVTYMSRSKYGIMGNTDELFTDKNEAQKSADEENEGWNRNGSTLKSEVMTLSDFFQKAKQERYYAGQSDESQWNDR